MTARIRIEHGWYGCETGCCGHTVYVEAPDGREADQFFFEHPWEATQEEFAEELVRMVIENRGAAAEIIAKCGGYEIESVETSDD